MIYHRGNTQYFSHIPRIGVFIEFSSLEFEIYKNMRVFITFMADFLIPGIFDVEK